MPAGGRGALDPSALAVPPGCRRASRKWDSAYRMWRHPGRDRGPYELLSSSIEVPASLRVQPARRPPRALCRHGPGCAAPRDRSREIASADPLGQRDDDSLGPAHVRHTPDVLVLPDPAHQTVAICREPLDNRIEVVHFEHHVAQSELVRHRGRRPRFVVGPGEARQLEPGTSAGWPQHDHLAAGAGDTGDGVNELAFHGHPALDLETEPDEDRQRPIEIGHRDADMIETSDARHGRTLLRPADAASEHPGGSRALT